MDHLVHAWRFRNKGRRNRYSYPKFRGILPARSACIVEATLRAAPTHRFSALAAVICRFSKPLDLSE
jgi:hypothetical protein